ncbi:amino acid adenylation domain-containing protein [Balneola sp. MJW-20]|uniref:non-ribosomal peptide synthetase n=1 Tax=Gracilimonas aurantiaca TaxID=3234185 RepID=UPI003467DF9F
MTTEELLQNLADSGIVLEAENDKLKINAPKGILDSERINEIKSRKDEILLFLDSEDSEVYQNGDNQRKVNDPAPLTFMQKSVWFLEKYLGRNTSNNLSATYIISGDLDKDIFRKSLQYVYKRQEALRIIIRKDGNTVQQVLGDEIDLNLEEKDLTTVKEPYRIFESTCLNALNTYMDPEKGPLFRGLLYDLEENVKGFFVNAHHLIFDEYSFNILLTELMDTYNALLKGEEPELPELTITYSEYARELQSEQHTESVNEHIDFWKEELKDMPVQSEFPTDRPRPAKPDFSYDVHEFLIPENEVVRLRELADGEGLSLNAVLMALYAVLVYRYSGEDDLILGTPVSLRNSEDLEPLIGMFQNILPVRYQVSAGINLREFLKYSDQLLHKCLKHSEAPFGFPDSNGINNLYPFIQHGLVYYPAYESENSFGDIKVAEKMVESAISMFDLFWILKEREGDIAVQIEFSKDLFDTDTIIRLGNNFCTLMNDAALNPDKDLSDLEVISEQEKGQLDQWNSTQFDYGVNRSYQRWINDLVNEYPDSTALVFEDGSYTFSELNEKVEKVAAYLHQGGIKTNDIVGIYADRNEYMMIGILGILQAGAAYLPLDPNYPADRKKFMVADSGCSLIITEEKYRNRMSDHDTDHLYLDTDWEKIQDTKFEYTLTETGEDDLAYIIYTSGSTGTPKGVMVTYGNLIAYSVSVIDFYELNSNDTGLQFGTMNFDVFIEEIFPPLLAGGKIVLRDESCALGGTPFWSFVEKHQITYLTLPTAFWHTLCTQISKDHVAKSNSLRILIFGGEDMSANMLEKWQAYFGNRIRLLNVYGPSETTVTVTAFECQDFDTSKGKVPIGKPFNNVKCYVLDENKCQCPIGVVGELYIEGPFVAKGYLNRDKLTRERFCEHSFPGKEKTVLYKSGDIVKYLPDGNILFVGRNDNQVKIRGFRIELGEIESVLMRYEEIREAVVIVREDVHRDKKIAAYVVPEGNDLDVLNLKASLRNDLAAHMIPSAIVVMNELPLTNNGKINRKILPVPERKDMTENSEIISPESDLQEDLASIWKDILSVSPISINDNFFEIGGDSLLAVQLIDRIRSKMEIELPLAVLFIAPTIRKLAGVIEADYDERKITSGEPLVPINVKGDEIPFFCIHGHLGNVLNFVTLSRVLGENQPFYGLQAIGIEGTEKPKTDIVEIASRFLEEIKTVQPEGPYMIGGYCFGSLIAIELSNQLRQQGDEISELIFLDPQPDLYPGLLSEKFINKFKDFHRGQYRELHKINIASQSIFKSASYLLDKVRNRITKWWINSSLIFFDFISRKIGWPIPGIYRNVEFTNNLALKKYVLNEPWDGDLHLILSKPAYLNYQIDPASDWKALATGEVKKYYIHDTASVAGGDMFKIPYVFETGEHIHRCLNRQE